MSEGWKRLDLAGGGLQSANLRLARELKRRRRAYALWLAFPLGLHHDYLGNAAGGWLFRGLSLAAVVLAFVSWPAAIAAAIVLLALAVHDLVWIDRRVVALNKAIRQRVFLSGGAAPPEGYRGRDPDAEASGAPRPGSRALSFAEQERLLRELAASERKGPDHGDRD
ncbi:MAG: hypothetical protein N2544_13190 [Burkholderiales bacterium]|nr:hypothetical protein [Burkholderiales bacterium]